MYAYKITNNRKENGYKNKSRSIITNKNPNINAKQNNNYYINQMKKEILGRRQEDHNIYNKRPSRNIKHKSIDNSFYNQNKYQNSSIIYNNPRQNQKKISKPTKMSNNKINFPSNFLWEPNKNFLNKNKLNIITNNIKNSQNQKSQNLTTNSNGSLFSYSNNVNEFTPSNDKFEESKDFYEYDNTKLVKNKIITTFVQIDDLTPIPDRIGAKQHCLAEYDYDEAKRAAVTCRRIEYSYNLRNVIRSEICLDQIITIQRWWREILKKRNIELLKELQMQERLKMNNLQGYILLINKLHYVYTIHLVKRFLKLLKIKYGKLYYKNVFNRNAEKIQNAYRQYILRKKFKLQTLLKRLAFKKKKINFFYHLNQSIMDINKLIKLQHFIKYYLLKKREKYYLRMANKIHPFMYYYLKYGIGNNDKDLNLIRYKINGFLNMVQKWKKFIKTKRILKSLLLMENIKFILKKKYFIYFILRIVERINSMITYFLLKPLIKDICSIYYRNKLNKIVLRWKINVKKLKRREILALNIILKLVSKITFRAFIKKIKKRIYDKEEINE